MLIGASRSATTRNMPPRFARFDEGVRAVYPVPPEDLPDLGPDHSFKTMAVWNRKGGVAKTTTTHALGVAYALKGRRVLMVDADPQCDLSSLLLQEWVKGKHTQEETEAGELDYDLFYSHKVQCGSSVAFVKFSGRPPISPSRTGLKPGVTQQNETKKMFTLRVTPETESENKMSDSLINFVSAMLKVDTSSWSTNGSNESFTHKTRLFFTLGQPVQPIR